MLLPMLAWLKLVEREKVGFIENTAMRHTVDGVGEGK